MKKTRLPFSVGCAFALLVIVGCNSTTNIARNPGSGGGTTPTPTPTPTALCVGSGPIADPSVYVVDDTHSPEASVLIFLQKASGPSCAAMAVPGRLPSTDKSGNIYVLAPDKSAINEYSAAGVLVRSLPVGPDEQIKTVNDMQASATGEIFVAEADGVAVFSPKATGNDTPLRTIRGISPLDSSQIVPAHIAVDSADNLYVVGTAESSILVFGPKDNGAVVPARVIAGPLTYLTTEHHLDVAALTTNASGNLYVLCLCYPHSETENDLGVLEFDAAANGNVAPLRLVSAQEMYPNFGNSGLGVDAAGNIYVSSSTDQGTMTVFEFSPSDSGVVTPTRTVSITGWLDALDSRIAVH